MVEHRRSIFAFVATGLLLMALGVPATALASQERATVSVEFESTVDQQGRVQFVDGKYATYVNEGINGYVAAHKDWAVLVLEGNDSDIDQELESLREDSQLATVNVLDRVEVSTSEFGHVSTHTELDIQSAASEDHGADTFKRSYIRAKFKPGLTENQKLGWHANYFEDFANAGLGGNFINGHGHDMITIELEGKPSKVDYWLQQLAGDPVLDEMTVLRSDYLDQPSFDDLVGHTGLDERDSND